MSLDRTSSAALRLRRTRVLMAALFTAVTAVCLVLLGALALQLDASSRAARLDGDVGQRAGGLARGVYFDRSGLRLEPIREDELAVGADAVAVYLVSGAGQAPQSVLRSGSEGDLPDTRLGEELVDTVLDEQGTITTRAAASGGVRMAWAAAPVWDGDRIGAVVVVGQDASAESRAHDQLALGMGLGCLALLIVAGVAGYWLSGRAMRPAVEALAGQEQFLTEAAHELRTPLSALRLLVESADGSEAHRALGAVDRLDHLITGLLARARVEAGTFEPERIPLRLDQLVQQVVDEFDEPRRLRFDAEPSVVTGDPVLLGQAVRNLVENALRHAPGARVEVAVRDGVLSVGDSGPGIPPSERAAALERGVGSGVGTGTGLAIVTWVARLHGGSVTLGDRPGGGLLVELALPPVS